MHGYSDVGRCSLYAANGRIAPTEQYLYVHWFPEQFVGADRPSWYISGTE